MPTYKVSSKYGVEEIEAKNTYALIQICDRKYQDDWEAEEVSPVVENNKRYAELIEEQTMLNFNAM